MRTLTSAELNRYSIAVHDFEQAIKLAEESLLHSPDSLAKEALLFMAVVVYYRPFSQNERSSGTGDAVSKLAIDDFAPLSKEELALHDLCKNLRNRALAHAEFAYFPTSHDPESGVIFGKRFSLVSLTVGSQSGHGVFDVESFCRLAYKLAARCHTVRANHVLRN
ncbi:hypothetical protein [Methyloversatilis universalis]|uniref:hypothetical protein n=1 Tax=Methyloversatilis universalis TaxID=378211 RepID=UPI001111CC68|nr:hypothetical protein [Methyloversatilis universalis]